MPSVIMVVALIVLAALVVVVVSCVILLGINTHAGYDQLDVHDRNRLQLGQCNLSELTRFSDHSRPCIPDMTAVIIIITSMKKL